MLATATATAFGAPADGHRPIIRMFEQDEGEGEQVAAQNVNQRMEEMQGKLQKERQRLQQKRSSHTNNTNKNEDGTETDRTCTETTATETITEAETTTLLLTQETFEEQEDEVKEHPSPSPSMLDKSTTATTDHQEETEDGSSMPFRKLLADHQQKQVQQPMRSPPTRKKRDFFNDKNDSPLRQSLRHAEIIDPFHVAEAEEESPRHHRPSRGGEGERKEGFSLRHSFPALHYSPRRHHHDTHDASALRRSLRHIDIVDPSLIAKEKEEEVVEEVEETPRQQHHHHHDSKRDNALWRKESSRREKIAATPGVDITYDASALRRSLRHDEIIDPSILEEDLLRNTNNNNNNNNRPRLPMLRKSSPRRDMIMTCNLEEKPQRHHDRKKDATMDKTMHQTHYYAEEERPTRRASAPGFEKRPSCRRDLLGDATYLRNSLPSVIHASHENTMEVSEFFGLGVEDNSNNNINNNNNNNSIPHQQHQQLQQALQRNHSRRDIVQAVGLEEKPRHRKEGDAALRRSLPTHHHMHHEVVQAAAAEEEEEEDDDEKPRRRASSSRQRTDINLKNGAPSSPLPLRSPRHPVDLRNSMTQLDQMAVDLELLLEQVQQETASATSSAQASFPKGISIHVPQEEVAEAAQRRKGDLVAQLKQKDHALEQFRQKCQAQAQALAHVSQQKAQLEAALQIAHGEMIALKQHKHQETDQHSDLTEDEEDGKEGEHLRALTRQMFEAEKKLLMRDHECLALAAKIRDLEQEVRHRDAIHEEAFEDLSRHADELEHELQAALLQLEECDAQDGGESKAALVSQLEAKDRRIEKLKAKIHKLSRTSSKHNHLQAEGGEETDELMKESRQRKFHEQSKDSSKFTDDARRVMNLSAFSPIQEEEPWQVEKEGGNGRDNDETEEPSETCAAVDPEVYHQSSPPSKEETRILALERRLVARHGTTSKSLQPPEAVEKYIAELDDRLAISDQHVDALRQWRIALVLLAVVIAVCSSRVSLLCTKWHVSHPLTAELICPS